MRHAMKREFIDYHCHLLPLLDDGASDPQESLTMARVLARFFSVVHCSPHRIRGCYDNEPGKVVQAVRLLQRQVHEAGINLRLVPSTEHYLDEFLLDQLPDVLTTGAKRLLLVESPFSSGGELLPSMVSGLIGRGIVPIIAHPERCLAFDVREEGRGAFSFFAGRARKTDLQGTMVTTLRNAGCRYQGNLGSFAGAYGIDIKQRALLFLKEGLYSCLGSDAHRSDRLERTLSAGLETVIATIGEEAAHALMAGAGLD